MTLFIKTMTLNNPKLLATPVLTPEWVTPAFIAFYYNRTDRLVRKWCDSGYLVRRGFIVHQDSNRRWWIKITDKSAAPPVKAS